MEKKLKKIFDYQRFEKNDKLEELMRETESRYAAALSDDDLSLVNAAGEIQKEPATIGENSFLNGGGIYTGGSGSVGVNGEVGSPFGSGGGGGGAGAGGKGTAM